MSTPRTILRAFSFGLIVEAMTIGLSFALGALSYRREPMDDPFSWLAIVLQMPAAFFSDRVVDAVGNDEAWFRWTFIFCVQALLWSIVIFGYLRWRDGRRRDVSA
jgi:hypothetical protein